MSYALCILGNNGIPDGLGRCIYRSNNILVIHEIERALEILDKTGKKPEPTIVTLSKQEPTKQLEYLAGLFKSRVEVLVSKPGHHYTGDYKLPPVEIIVCHELLNSEGNEKLISILEELGLNKKQIRQRRQTSLDVFLKQHYKQ